MRSKVSSHAALTAICLALSLAPHIAHALIEGTYTYTTNNLGQANLTDFNDSYSGVLSIPNTLGGYPVTDIGTEAFFACLYLTKATIPVGVTSIGVRSFGACTRLTTVSMPNSVRIIGEDKE